MTEEFIQSLDENQKDELLKQSIDELVIMGAMEFTKDGELVNLSMGNNVREGL
jgi:hypothetical protein